MQMARPQLNARHSYKRINFYLSNLLQNVKLLLNPIQFFYCSSSTVTIPYSASSVAAKIMARYGFKDGQGLGKQEQGMSMALQVEKTSKRGGRIIHEKELFIPPPTISSPPSSMPPPSFPISVSTRASSPTHTIDSQTQQKAEPSITEIMKEPSKVVLLRV